MHVVFVAGRYPSAARPVAGSFIKEFALAVSRLGHRCTVISPTSIFDLRHGRLPDPFCVDKLRTAQVEVLRPRFISFSVRAIAGLNAALLTHAIFARAVWKSLSRLDQRADVIYGHFLYPAGYAAVRVAERVDIPSVVGVGEGEFWTVEPVGFLRAQRHFQQAPAFLAVSNVIREKLNQQLGVPKEKIRVFPNGVDLSIFNPRNRSQMCRKHRIPEGTFNICFIGTFDELKGPARLLDATKDLPNVSLILIGEGKVRLESRQTVFRGIVPHHEVPEYVSACDLFVLPTTVEGCCNSILEAMACGIPIVTSNCRFNDDIVNDDVATRVDPHSVSELRAAIVKLIGDSDRRKAMKEACLRNAPAFDINLRAARVTEWMAKLDVPRCRTIGKR